MLMKQKWEDNEEIKTFSAQGGQDTLIDKSNNKLINQIKMLCVYLKLLT